jgi:hypothetical protein
VKGIGISSYSEQAYTTSWTVEKYGLILFRDGGFSSLESVPAGSGVHPASGVLSPGVRRPGRKVNHSSPPIAELENEWSHTPTPPIYLHDVEIDYFILCRMRQQAYEAQCLNMCNERKIREYKNLFLQKEEKETAEGNVNDYDYDDNGDDPIQDMFSE